MGGSTPEAAMDRGSIETFLRTTASELAIKILAALAFWIIGRWLIGKVVGLMQAAMNRNDIDPTLTKYLGSIVAIALNIALVLGILGYFGIQTTSFAAACSATSRPAPSCWCCGPSRSATSCRWAASPARCTSSVSSARPSSRPTTS
jgi:hypothetical protein